MGQKEMQDLQQYPLRRLYRKMHKFHGQHGLMQFGLTGTV